MSYDEYWYGDPYLTWDYYEAEKFRMKRKEEDFWLQGVYVFNALQAALSASELFRKKGAKPIPYPQKVHGIYDVDKQKQARKDEVNNERLRARAYLDSLIRTHKARRGQKDIAPST